MATLIPVVGDALLVIDVQYDFLPGGSLEVPEGDAVIPPLNRCIALFTKLHLPIYASRDWHPVNHRSFRAQGGPWPPHCVQGSHGAEFAATLALPADTVVISKDYTPELSTYSDFTETDFDQRLRAAKIRRLFVGGLATDYCVLNTVKEALALGYTTVVLTDTIRPVEVKPGDGERALAEMRRLGAQLATSAELQP